MDISCVHVLPPLDILHSQSDVAGWFVGSYGELEGEDNCHADGDRNDQLNDLFGSMFQGSLQWQDKMDKKSAVYMYTLHVLCTCTRK